jgi:DNA-binding GntR family transcriptional regulator
VTDKVILRRSAKHRTDAARPASVRAAEIDFPGSSKSQPDAALSRKAYEAILQGIFTGRLFPGKVLSEVAMARELAMSRTPIHSAIWELMKDGLVAKEKNRRPIVCQFTRTDLQELFEMRRLLEGEAAFRAASRIDRPTLAHFRSAGEAMEAHLNDPGILPKWIDFDDEFHCVIAQASGNRRLEKDIERYRTIHRGLIPMRLKPEHVPQAFAEHMRLLDALERRDPEQARQAMSEHIQEWQVYCLRFFSDSGA